MPKISCLTLLLLACLASPAYAARTGDMFNDSFMTDDNRPWVPSDRTHHSDMFGGVPQNYMRSDKDVFDNVHPPGDFGIEQHFSAHVNSIPDEPLYNWPNDSHYP